LHDTNHRHLGHSRNFIQENSRKSLLGRDAESSSTDRNAIGSFEIEQGQQLDITVDQRIAKTDLHEHQDHGESHPGCCKDTLAPTGGKVFPSQWSSHSVGRFKAMQVIRSKNGFVSK
jgi:hypothetical protein